MRTTAADSTVRLYHLGDDGTTSTLMYGMLQDALDEARRQPEALRDGLFVQTADDVVAYLDLIGGGNDAA